MGKSKVDKNEITSFILSNLAHHSRDIVKITSSHFNVSRQTVYRYLHLLISNGDILAKGENRNKSYHLNFKMQQFVFQNKGNDWDEEVVWRNYVKKVLPPIPMNVLDICHYGVGEMVNNIIDHSEATEFTIIIEINSQLIRIWLIDNGIGIFTKIQRDFNLQDKRHAILELAKGKLTSDPSRHTGEGIFFTSRMYDEFAIISEDIAFLGHYQDDWLLPDRPNYVKGTVVFMSIRKEAKQTMKEIFDRFTPDIDDDDFGFQRTTVPVRLAQYEGESLVSRSQAKRLITRFDQFKEVILDFKSIEIIGQPFADEVFRVFRNDHPNTHLRTINTNEDIDKMIKHVTGDSI